MKQVVDRCAGLDVHKKTVAVCVCGCPTQAGAGRSTCGPSAPPTGDLLILRDWLATHGVSHVAMESTGVYWRPVFYILEEAFTCILANAAQIAQVPDRKTDIKDCVCIAQEHRSDKGPVDRTAVLGTPPGLTFLSLPPPRYSARWKARVVATRNPDPIPTQTLYRSPLTVSRNQLVWRSSA